MESIILNQVLEKEKTLPQEIKKMKKTFLFIVGLVILLLAGSSLLAQSNNYKVIVNNANSVNSMTKKEVSNLFLKKTTKWSSGEKVQPVDLVDTSAIRQGFSKGVHGRKVSSIKAYWQKEIFSGRNVPPAEKKTEREVLQFVSNNPGAVGYVSGSAILGNNQVKELEID
jgi:ABC-type phosphate transport system substrate-binding protein